ncbi:MAG: hypothetical protein ABI867_11415 [Kofleriaceae bacterium]
MNKKLILVSIFALGACMDVDSDIPDDTDSQRLAANGLLASDVLATGFDAAVLDQAHADSTVMTSAGINTMRYVIACALAPGHYITLNGQYDDGSPYSQTLQGMVGVADSWTSTALTTLQQRAVTACVLAYTNRLGTSVTISLRGPLPTYATTTPETTGYQVQEGAFFGNLFKGGDGAMACKGTGNTTATGRDCAKSTGGGATQCGYTYVGTCASVCSTASGYLINCAGSGVTYAQPVTVFDSI